MVSTLENCHASGMKQKHVTELQNWGWY